ncbi:MAG: hypothetical protein HOF14_00650 [Deltaproteobacteria bacterium]|nr:hypothetical protein [Deltaproteobacteria bacterium]
MTEVIIGISSLKITKRPESLVQVARDAIRQGILRKELKLGQLLKKASLVQAFTVCYLVAVEGGIKNRITIVEMTVTRLGDVLHMEWEDFNGKNGICTIRSKPWRPSF